jgi:hypothetical protein
MRYRRHSGLLAGQRATANMAIGNEGPGGTTRGEPRPDAKRPMQPRTGRSSPGIFPSVCGSAVHPCTLRHMRVTYRGIKRRCWHAVNAFVAHRGEISEI